MEEKIKQRIEELKKGKEMFMAEANRQMGAYDGAIGELERMLNPETPPNGGAQEVAQADAM